MRARCKTGALVRALQATVVVAVVALTIGAARAERGEMRFGGGAVAVFPALSPIESTQMASLGFGARMMAELGAVHHRLRFVGQFSAWRHGGDLTPYAVPQAEGPLLTGTLRYHGEAYRGELGVAWQALAGHSLAPYLRALVGYQWTTFRERSLVAFGQKLPDLGESSVTVGVGATLEKRLFNRVVCGVSMDATRTFSALYRYDFSASFFTSYYWF